MYSPLNYSVNVIRLFFFLKQKWLGFYVQFVLPCVCCAWSTSVRDQIYSTASEKGELGLGQGYSYWSKTTCKE